MNKKEKNKSTVYKNDLKFNNFDLETSDFESEHVREMYNDYRSKPRIELRIKDSQMENYEYLDLSNLDIDDNNLEKLFSLDRIKEILSKIKFLDLSSNNLTIYPDLSEYPNILYLSIFNNKIDGEIIDNNLLELSCDNNLITKIKSKTITKLNASNNHIKKISIPNIKVLLVNNNKLNNIDEYEDLEYLECISNEIKTINNLANLKELFVSNNKLESISKLPKIKTVNCTNNPINKIGYLNNLQLLVCSTNKISSKYTVEGIVKIKKDYLINLTPNQKPV